MLAGFLVVLLGLLGVAEGRTDDAEHLVKVDPLSQERGVVGRPGAEAFGEVQSRTFEVAGLFLALQPGAVRAGPGAVGGPIRGRWWKLKRKYWA